MAADAQIRLTKDATVVDLPGPPSGGTTVRNPVNYVTGATVDGMRYAYQTSASARRLWTIPLADLSAANKADLESFFALVGGPSQEWSYRHTDGTSYAGVRFVTPGLEFVRLNPRQWATTITIETAGAVS